MTNVEISNLTDEQVNTMAKFAWAENDHVFKSKAFDSFEDAVNDAKAESDCEIVFIGSVVECKNNQFFPDGWDIINHMANAAVDSIGDAAMDYPDVSNDDANDLTEMVHAAIECWCKKRGVSPEFYMIDESKPIKIK